MTAKSRPTSFAFSEATRSDLNFLKMFYRVTGVGVIEMLIAQAAREARMKVDPHYTPPKEAEVHDDHPA